MIEITLLQSSVQKKIVLKKYFLQNFTDPFQ